MESFRAIRSSLISKEKSKNELPEVLVDDEINLQFKRLHQGITVGKVSRHDKVRDIKLMLSENNYFLRWQSKMLSLKFGRMNKRKRMFVYFNKLFQCLFNLTSFLDTVNSTQIVSVDQKNLKEPLELSICYNKNKNQEDKSKILTLRLKDDEDTEILKNVIKALILKRKQEIENLTPDKLFLIEIWNRADDDGNGMVHETEIYNLLRSLNVNMRQNDCKNLFAEFDTDNSKTLDFNEFTKFVEKLKERYESLISMLYAAVLDLLITYFRPEFLSMWSQIMDDEYTGVVNGKSPETILSSVKEENRTKTVDVLDFVDIWYAVYQL